MSNKGVDILAETANTEIKKLPPWLRRSLLILIILAAITIGIFYFWPFSKISASQAPAKKFYSIQGIAILQKNGINTILKQHTIGLGNASPLQTSNTGTDGSFYLENVFIPDDKTVIILNAITSDGTVRATSKRDIKAFIQGGDGPEIQLGHVYFEEYAPVAVVPPVKSTKAVSTKTFSINIKDQELITNIKHYTGYTYSPTSSLHIELKQSGDLQEVNNGLYYYQGGNLEITVPVTNCRQILSYAINRTLQVGNSRNYVEEKLNENITQIVKNNPSAIAKKVAECLK